jgi:hypothetical protein
MEQIYCFKNLGHYSTYKIKNILFTEIKLNYDRAMTAVNQVWFRNIQELEFSRIEQNPC